MLPCYYHPTKIVFLDDELDWLKILTQNLPDKGNSYELFDKPLSAIKYINDHKSQSKPLFVESKNPHYSLNNFSLDLNITDSYKEIFKEDRTDIISTIVVDYKMPQMNGLDFLKSIRDENIKKILLTGEADENIAIDAFNKGLIDHYLKKQDPDVDQKLGDIIDEMTISFFTNISKPFIASIDNPYDHPLAIESPEFIDYFTSILQEYDIKEFYIFESIGSFVLIDKNGSIYSLFTQNDDIADGFYIEVKDVDNNAISEELKAKIKNKELIFCFIPKEGQAFPKQEEWKKYFKAAKQVGINNKFYTALVPGFSKID